MTVSLGLFVLASALAMPPAPSAPALCSSAPAAVERPSFAAGITGKSTCIADCGDLNSNVSCSGTVCSAVNQAQTCPTGPGSVTCDGQTFYCAACCTNGTIRNVTTGPICSCEGGQTTPKDQYKCINGLWEYQSSFCGGPFCHG
jgi:hypothetical protein